MLTSWQSSEWARSYISFVIVTWPHHLPHILTAVFSDSLLKNHNYYSVCLFRLLILFSNTYSNLRKELCFMCHNEKVSILFVSIHWEPEMCFDAACDSIKCRVCEVCVCLLPLTDWSWTLFIISTLHGPADSCGLTRRVEDAAAAPTPSRIQTCNKVVT